jgi:hypothetical protein
MHSASLVADVAATFVASLGTFAGTKEIWVMV